jgi:hypothetical protein
MNKLQFTFLPVLTINAHYFFLSTPKLQLFAPFLSRFNCISLSMNAFGRNEEEKVFADSFQFEKFPLSNSQLMNSLSWVLSLKLFLIKIILLAAINF